MIIWKTNFADARVVARHYPPPSVRCPSTPLLLHRSLGRRSWRWRTTRDERTLLQSKLRKRRLVVLPAVLSLSSLLVLSHFPTKVNLDANICYICLNAFATFHVPFQRILCFPTCFVTLFLYQNYFSFLFVNWILIWDTINYYNKNIKIAFIWKSLKRFLTRMLDARCISTKVIHPAEYTETNSL